MAFRDILGQETAINFLKKSIANNHLSHAYLFTGPSGVGKKTAAFAFAQAINCLDNDQDDSCNQCSNCRKFLDGNCPDVNFLQPEGLSLKIDQIREIRLKSYYRSYESKYKTIIIDDAHLLTEAAANSILKVLEEPTSNTIFILITPAPQQLLKTILSRCQEVKFNYLNTEELSLILKEKYQEDIPMALIAGLAKGSAEQALGILTKENVLEERQQILKFLLEIERMTFEQILAFAEKWSKEREKIFVFLEIARLWYRDLLVWGATEDQKILINQDQIKFIKEQETNSKQVSSILKMIEECFYALRFNVNPRLTLETFLLKIKFN